MCAAGYTQGSCPVILDAFRSSFGRIGRGETPPGCFLKPLHPSLSMQHFQKQHPSAFIIRCLSKAGKGTDAFRMPCEKGFVLELNSSSAHFSFFISAILRLFLYGCLRPPSRLFLMGLKIETSGMRRTRRHCRVNGRGTRSASPHLFFQVLIRGSRPSKTDTQAASLPSPPFPRRISEVP